MSSFGAVLDPDDPNLEGAKNLWRYGRRPAWTWVRITALLASPFFAVALLHALRAPGWLG